MGEGLAVAKIGDRVAMGDQAKKMEVMKKEMCQFSAKMGGLEQSLGCLKKDVMGKMEQMMNTLNFMHSQTVNATDVHNEDTSTEKVVPDKVNQ